MDRRAFGPEDEDESNIDKFKKNNKSETPILDHYGKDLTELAKKGALDPVVGRDVEVDKMIQILNKRRKNNPVLVGEAGVGKTAIAEGLALRIANRQVDRWLFNKRIIELNFTTIVSGTKYRGEFEQRMEEILKEAKKSPDVIIFIDELHNVVGAGGASGSMDASNIIKPALARGEIKVIGATTVDEYKKIIEGDSALERRFQKIYVNVPSKEDTFKILKQLREKYEDYHNVSYSDEVLEKCVELTDRYINYRNFPDKAIDAMDEVGSRVKLNNTSVPESIKKLEKELDSIISNKKDAAKIQKYEDAAKFRDKEREINKRIEEEKVKWEHGLKKNKTLVTIQNVAEIISNHTGIPLSKLTDDENKKLAGMQDFLSKKVIGQEEAVIKVCEAIQRSRLGLQDPNKPIASFLLLGSTGVGKCHGKGTKILMYDGSIKSVEDIREGENIMGDDSNPRRVLSLARGKERMYKIIPKKGGDEFVCNESHILSLKNTSTKKIINISIKDYLQKNNWFKHTHKLYRVGVEYDRNLLGIDPYFLGLWLGDGNSKRVGITTADKEIVNYLEIFTEKINSAGALTFSYGDDRDDIHEDYRISIHEHNNKSNTYYISTGKNGGESCVLREQFKFYNLLDNKHIPFDYLTSHREDRMALLAGLIDSDGYMFNKSYEIAQKNKELANNIVMLARSLGYCAYIKEKEVKGVVYSLVKISGDLSELPIKLERKKSTIRKQVKDVLVTGFNIVNLGEGDYYGFELDGNHLYLLGDFTVTHNTHLAKQLAKFMFHKEDAFIRFDMSEYMEKFTISKLIGSPPGYVGYEDKGLLTEAVKNKPYSILLFDEIEKAHPDVFNIFLQILDDGILTDSVGREINFKNCIIIMTSNIGTEKIMGKKTLGFGTGSDEHSDISSIVGDELKKHLRPELINRIDEKIVFKTLSQIDISKIVDLELERTINRISDKGYDISVAKSVRDYLAEIGYDKEYGARPLKRAITSHVENVISQCILKNTIKEGDKIKLSYDKKLDKVIAKI